MEVPCAPRKILVPRRRLVPQKLPLATINSEVVELRQKHPLETEVVLKHLFGFMSVRDLCSLREVNKAWNGEAVPQLKRRSRPTFFIRPPHFQGDIQQQIARLIACAHASPDFPFSKLDMVSYDFPGDSWNELVCSAASWVTTLMFWAPAGYEGQPILSPGTGFPKLRDLQFGTVGPRPEHCTFFLQVVENAPQLTTLEVRDWENNAFLWRQLGQVKGLRLKHLTLDCWNQVSEQDCSRACLQFLQSQENSLQTLTLRWRHSHQFKLLPSELYLPELEGLDVSWEEGDTMFQTPVQWARSFPNLRALHLAGGGESRNWEPCFGRQRAASWVTQLQLTGLRNPPSQQLFLEHGPKMFPQLEKLEIGGCSRLVWNVAELVCAFGKLRELSLCVTRTTDLAMALTGGTWEMEELTGEQPLRELEEEWRRQMDTEPYSALRRLRLLKIQHETFGYDHEYEEDVLYLPLSLCRLLSVLMPNLQILHLARKHVVPIAMRGPRPLPGFVAELERNTAIIFN